MKHRTKIIQKRIHSSAWIFSFTCASCDYTKGDYSREWHHGIDGRDLAVDDARAHRFAYRAIDRILEEEEAHRINDEMEAANVR